MLRRIKADRPSLVVGRAGKGDLIYFDMDEESFVGEGDYVMAVDKDGEPFLAILVQFPPDLVLWTGIDPEGELNIVGKVYRIEHDLI